MNRYKIHFLLLIFTSNYVSFGMENPDILSIRKNLSQDNLDSFLQSSPSLITIVDKEEQYERLGKCIYFTMTDIIGIPHEKAPFKLLGLNDWSDNLKLKQYFDHSTIPVPGCMVIYFSKKNKVNQNPLHFGYVIRINPINSTPIVRSKWGGRKEIFEHELPMVPLSYKHYPKFFTLKPQYQQEGKKIKLLTAIQANINASQSIAQDCITLGKSLLTLAQGIDVTYSGNLEFNNLPSIQEKIFYFLKTLPGINIDFCNEQDDTPLMTAVRQGDFDTIELLVHFEADVNKKNKNGDTALTIAQQNFNNNPNENNETIIQFLTKK